ncbi:MAG: hypothetical protein ACK53V_26725, partial [Planctomycetota bacterium]
MSQRVCYNTAESLATHLLALFSGTAAPAMNVLLFEDEFVSRLYPITTGRPAFSTSCGSFRLLDWVEA